MIRRLIILSLIVGCVFAHEEMGELEKEMLYKQNDRSPLLAGICALTPTMGHLYLGKWNKRLFTTTLPFGLTTLAFYVSADYSYGEEYRSEYNCYGCTDDYDEWVSSGKKSNHEDWGNIGEFFTGMSILTLAIWYPLQLQDAIYLAYQHNADLYEEIYGKEYIRPPKKSLIQKWIDKKEAKKDSIPK